ncbi:MAG: DUF924 domain-containing protein, partial [Gammaproteobacteria bacterium]|nr:DUF924 domain-containing protein [Gammaproteobacteria bacterium]
MTLIRSQANGHAIIATMSNPDINRVLEFWFADAEQDSLRVDSRMDRWFGNNAEFDEQILNEFGALTEQASAGQLDEWAKTPEGRLALIIMLDQFRRNIYRN